MNPKYELQPIKQMVTKITRRALKACASCRRQKTKCFANSADDSGSCLRCASVGRVCSFVIDNIQNHQSIDPDITSNDTQDEANEDGSDDSNNRSVKKRRLEKHSAESITNEQVGTSSEMSSISIANTLIDNNTKLNHLNNNVKKILSILSDQHQLQQFQNQHQLLNLPPLPSELSNAGIIPSVSEPISLPSPLRISSTRAVSSPPRNIPQKTSSAGQTSKYLSVESGFAPSTTSPFQIIQSSVSSEYTPITIQQLLAESKATSSLEENEPENILSLGIISLTLTIQLVNNFKDNYEQWISLPRSLTTEELVYDLKYKCPILLTSICLTSLRYDYKKSINHDVLIRQLISRLKIELKEHLTSYDEFKNLEFLKALVILCVYGHSISSEKLILDPWFLSGIAIEWFLTLDRNNSFLSLKDHDNSNSLLHQLIIDEDEEEKLSNFRIWNHICLVHLTNCVFSGRQCLVDEIRLDQSRKNLELPLATNFDGRMIGEISLQLLLYNYIQTSCATGDLRDSFENFELELKQWHKQWKYLFDQPNLQFVEFGYHYSYVAALYHYKLGGVEFDKVGDAFIDDIPILSKMLYHSLRVLNPILKLNKDQTVYFSSLSDQIHLCLYYSCLVLLKTLGWLKKFDKSMTYSPQELWNFASNVELIRIIYEKISRNDQDLAHKYSKGLELALGKLDIDER